MPSMPYRDLSTHASPDFQRGLPQRPTHWSEAELADWKAHLLRQPWVNAKRLEASWERMLAHRRETLERDVPYRGRDLPPAEVVAELPYELLTQRAYLRSPKVALLSDQVLSLLQDIAGAPEKASAASGKRLAQLLGAWAPGQRLRRGFRHRPTDGGPASAAGGLRVQVVGATLEVAVCGITVCQAPASDAQARRLRRLASLWARLVRGAVASALQLGAPLGASLSTPLELVLPALAAGDPGLAYVPDRRTLTAGYRTILWDTNFYADQAARHALAGAMLRRGAGDAAFEACVQRHLEVIFDGLPLRALRPVLSADAVLARADEVSRSFITAFAGQVPVELSSMADRYEVRVDDITGPRLLATVHSLALAVDLERSHRREVGMRLVLAAAAA